MTFTTDLEFGELSEERLKNELAGHGYSPSSIVDTGFDIRYEVRVEVKTDRMWQETGNVGIEYMYKDEPSGISNTTAQIFVYVLEGVDAFWYARVDDLKYFLRTQKIKRVVGGDKKQSKLFLLTLSQFHKIFRRLP